MNLEAGRTYTIPIQANGEEDLAGFQVNFNFSHSKLEFIRANSLLERAHVTSKEGMLSAIYYGPQNIQAEDFYFELTFLAKQNALLSEVLSLSNDRFNSEVYTNDLDRRELEVQFTADPRLQVHQNSPNPYTGWTRIAFELPATGFVAFEVMDATGKVLYTDRKEYEKGYNEINLTKENIATSGVLYYRIVTDTEQITKKMIALD
jgi:hypothetical protein